MKAMAIASIKNVVLWDHNSSLLASGEKILVTHFNPLPPEQCDFYTALIRNEVDCSLETTKWMDKIERERKYSFSDDSYLDKKKEGISQQQDDNGDDDGDYDGDYSLDDYEMDPEEYHNIINMMEK